MNDLNKLKTKRNDLLQQRADALDAATKKYSDGDMTGYNADMEKVKGYKYFGKWSDVNKVDRKKLRTR